MKLTGRKNTVFSLSVAGYQYPKNKDHDYDVNWLLIVIDVKCPRGSWQTTDPSLETFELRKLANWLQGLNRKGTTGDEIDFTEPNLTFQYLGKEGDHYQVRAFFELELRPEWAPARVAGLRDLWVDLQATEKDLKEAAGSLKDILKKFPER